MDDEKNKKIDEAGGNKNKIIDFKTIRPYLSDLDWEKHYSHYVDKDDILNCADESDAPEEIFNLLSRLPVGEYHKFSEIRDAVRVLQTPVDEDTELDKLKYDLNKTKEQCDAKENRISTLEHYFRVRNFIIWTIIIYILISFPMGLYIYVFGFFKGADYWKNIDMGVQVMYYGFLIVWIILMGVSYLGTIFLLAEHYELDI